MSVVKQFFFYVIWICISLMFGILHMRIALGPYNADALDFWKMSSKILYDYTLIHVGFRVGLIIALLFLFIEVLYLKKRLSKSSKAIGIRFLCLIGVTLVVGFTHYILEKVIDVI